MKEPTHDAAAYQAFDRVAVLSNNKTHAKIDKKIMRLFAPGVVLVFEKGRAALDHIERLGVDLVLCDSGLDDMTGLEFLTKLRGEMKQRSLPVIMISLMNSREYVLDAIGQGCSGYVIRPYAPKTLEKYILAARRMADYPDAQRKRMEKARALAEQGDHQAAAEHYEEIISEGNEAQFYYDMGCSFLVRKEYAKAVVAFQKALKYNELFAEAYKGLAEAYKARGDFERYKTNIEKAAEVLAQLDRFEEAKMAFIQVLKHNREAHNPYKILGLKLRRDGDLDGAVEAYARALEMTPDDEHIHYNLSKALHLAGKEAEAQASIARALNLNPFFEEAKKLYAELFKKPFQAPLGAAFKGPSSAARLRGLDTD
ncbi:response regulator [Desulfovibrio aminophilus]|nr:response regulator [Desulfovibrio aminophilus]MCM0753793.1 response regulator [Desulfovibrio aminophilus]